MENLKEVSRLLEIHSALTGSGPGYKHNVEVLNKSAIVLLVAAWEAYVEDLASNAFEILMNKAKEPTVFPGRVLTRASRGLRESNDESEVWKLSGDGWKTILENHKEKIIDHFVGRFHSPNPNKIDDLFDGLIGLKNLSNEWHWHGMSSEQSANKLTELLILRGGIAHRVTAAAKVGKPQVEDYQEFLLRLGTISHNRALAWIYERTGHRPWRRYKKGTVA